MVARTHTHTHARKQERSSWNEKREGDDDTRLSLFYLGKCNFLVFFRGGFFFVLDCLGTNGPAGSIGLLFFISMI